MNLATAVAYLDAEWKHRHQVGARTLARQVRASKDPEATLTEAAAAGNIHAKAALLCLAVLDTPA